MNMIYLFILAMISFTSAIHYFVYFSWIRFFNITNSGWRLAWLLIFFALAFGFILFSALLQQHDNWLTRPAYIVSVSWLGILATLFTLDLLGWVLVYLSRIAKFNLPTPAMAAAFFIITAAVFIYGYFNAQNIRIRNLTVPISGLPDAWQEKTVIQISDVHASVLNNKNFIDRLIAKINGARAAAVFITGDYFDSRCCHLEQYTAPLKNLQAEKGVYFVTGNHETYTGVDLTERVLAQTGVRSLNDEVVDLDGLQILGVAYPMMGEVKDWDKILSNLTSDQPAILLYHQGGQRLAAQAAAAGVDLQLSGHFHAGQVWPFMYLSRLFYGKYYKGLHQLGDYTLYSSSGAGTWGPPIRTGNTPEIVLIKLEKK
jgi:hypothetical protein